jgi:[citrate (pro-3S)-lyase] ligase
MIKSCNSGEMEINMEIRYGSPLTGNEFKKTKEFLGSFSLDYEAGIEFTVNIMDDELILATGSRRGNILNCIAVSSEYRGKDLAAIIVTELINQAASLGITHLFLFTVPKNERIFANLGFWTIVKNDTVLLMENTKNGIEQFLQRLECPTCNGVIGCIIANCNPFTNGHRYLIETAAGMCDLLHLFILSEERSQFTAQERLMLTKQGVAHLKNVILHPTEDYLLSYATFPTYFIKDKADVNAINCMLDLLIFAKIVAKTLNIAKRFVGSEPLDPVTDFYNCQMKNFLPKYGIQVVELPRLSHYGEPVSASQVRNLIALGEYQKIKCLVPLTTYDYVIAKYGK